MRTRARSRVKDATKIELAFLRNDKRFRNVTLVELPNGDFGFTILRNFLFARVPARAVGGAASAPPTRNSPRSPQER